MKAESNAGFVTAPLLMAIAASFAILGLASSYINSFDKIIEKQNEAQAINKMEQIANLLVDNATANPTSMVMVPPAGTNSLGGADNPSTNDLPENGISLPNTVSAMTKLGEVKYFPFLAKRTASQDLPDGFYLALEPGLPAPDDVAFALVLPGPDGYIESSYGDISQGFTQGDDIAIFRTVGQVNGPFFAEALKNIGNIPTCTSADNIASGKTLPAWDRNSNNWTCRDGVKSFALSSNDVSVCPPGTSLTSVPVPNQPTPLQGQSPLLKLACKPTTVVVEKSPYGSLVEGNGQQASVYTLTDISQVAETPCSGNADTFRWDPNSSTPMLCGSSSGGAPATTSCPQGKFVIRSLSRYSTCMEYNRTNIAETQGTVRDRCQNGATPYFAAGRTYCPEDGAGGRNLCPQTGYKAAYVQDRGGIGCYIMQDPNMPGGITQEATVKLDRGQNCPDGSMLQIVSAVDNTAKCVGAFEAISWALPTQMCPASAGGVPGALTWNSAQQKFLCSYVN